VVTFWVCEACVNEADVVFVLDSSGSIDADDFSQILDFVSRLVDNFDVEGGAIRVGVVTYADDVQSASTFNLNQYSTRQAVKVSAIFSNLCKLHAAVDAL